MCDAAIDDVVLEAIGSGYPTELAGTSARALIREFSETPGTDRARRRTLMSALASNGSDEAMKFLLSERAAAKAPADRDRYTELLALTQNPRVSTLFKKLLVSSNPGERAHALGLASLLPFDWRSHLTKAIARSKNARARAAWVRALADGSPASLKRLASLYRSPDPATQAQILDAILPHYDAEDVLTPFLEPHLQRKANGDLRHRAMRHLAQSRHPPLPEVPPAALRGRVQRESTVAVDPLVRPLR